MALPPRLSFDRRSTAGRVAGQFRDSGVVRLDESGRSVLATRNLL